MIDIIKLVASFILLIFSLFSLSFFISSIFEKEKRASIYAAIQFIVLLAIFAVLINSNRIAFFSEGLGYQILILACVLFIIGFLLLIFPFGSNSSALKGTTGLIAGDVNRIDERNTVFSKLTVKLMDSNSKVPSSVLREKGKIDGIGGVSNIIMGEASSKFARSLATPEILTPSVASEKVVINPEEASIRIKGYAKSLGACLTGITEINPLWLYSHYGRSGMLLDEWGKEVRSSYKYAIVLAQEMDVAMINASPHTTSMLESLTNYAKGAFIATQVASYIAEMGYPAKVNQMAHYDALMVPLAVDAGLGELSRMGYLITKEYGPRVRLSAVLTDLPLIPDKPVDIGVADFCAKCKKCASCCPSNSIPFYDRKEKNGTLRWVIDPDSCFQYWQKLGTDCCICMRVCPWSHARTFPHIMISHLVSRNRFSRTLFSWMDDVYYGKHPRDKAPPEWAGYA